jgi:hypothetical protein
MRCADPGPRGGKERWVLVISLLQRPWQWPWLVVMDVYVCGQKCRPWPQWPACSMPAVHEYYTFGHTLGKVRSWGFCHGRRHSLVAWPAPLLGLLGAHQTLALDVTVWGMTG